MNEVNVNHGAVASPIKVAIGYAARLRINLTENGVAANTTGWTWQLLIKRFKGDRQNIVNLTLGNGLRYEIYSDVTLIADLTPTQTSVEEGEYYLVLIRTDLPRPMIEGNLLFNYGNPQV